MRDYCNSRFTFHVSRFTFHVSRFTFHVSRFTFHASLVTDPSMGILYVVSTPIGNLEDISLRALRVLREVALIAAEDTRHTRKLLAHHGIPARVLSVHEHN